MNILDFSNLKTKSLVILNVIILLSVVFSGIIYTCIIPVKADTEPNDSFATANVIAPDTYIGTLNITDTADYYKIHLTGGSIIEITFTSDASAYQGLTFYDPTKNEIFIIDSKENTEIIEDYYLANETTTNYWYISIGFDDVVEAPGSYSFTVSVTNQNDAGTGGDVSQEYINAFEIPLETEISGHLEDLDDEDMYMVNLVSGSIVTITFSSDANAYQGLFFYDPAKNDIFTIDSKENTEATEDYYLANETTEDYWYISIKYDDVVEAPGEYTFTVAISNQVDAGSLMDVAENYDNAFEIETSSMITGHLEDLDLGDMYKIYLEKSYYVTINFSYTSEFESGVILTFYNTNLDTIFSLPSIYEVPSHSIGEDEISGYWYVGLELSSGASWGNYTFKISIEKIQAPVIFNVTVITSSYYASISWETNEPTNGTVYYGLDDSYGLMEEDYSSNYYLANTHTVMFYNLIEGKTYHFKIVSWNSGGIKNETADSTFKMPRSTYVESQYNSLVN